jgi:hypothetical protein
MVCIDIPRFGIHIYFNIIKGILEVFYVPGLSHPVLSIPWYSISIDIEAANGILSSPVLIAAVSFNGMHGLPVAFFHDAYMIR